MREATYAAAVCNTWCPAVDSVVLRCVKRYSRRLFGLRQ